MAASGKLYQKMIDGTLKAICYGGGGGGGSTTSFDTDFAIKMSADQTIANLTTTKVSNFDTIIRDANSEWVAADLRWVCKTAGTYVVNASIFWTANTIGYRIIYVYVDGVAVQANTIVGSSVATNLGITYAMTLTAGQYVEIYVRHSKGSNLDLIASPAGGTPYEWQIFRIK